MTGDLDGAARRARAAVAAHEASPLRPELARSLLVLGQVERRRRARGQSRDALRRAHELATSMGHRPLLARIEREMPRVAAREPARTAGARIGRCRPCRLGRAAKYRRRPGPGQARGFRGGLGGNLRRAPTSEPSADPAGRPVGMPLDPPPRLGRPPASASLPGRIEA